MVVVLVYWHLVVWMQNLTMPYSLSDIHLFNDRKFLRIGRLLRQKQAVIVSEYILNMVLTMRQM